MRASNWSTTWVAHRSSTPRTLRRSKRSRAEVLLGRCVRGGASRVVCLCHRSARGCLPPYSRPRPLLEPLGEHGRGQHSPSLRTLRPWRMGSSTVAGVLFQRYGSAVPAGVGPRPAHGWREHRHGLGCGRGQAQACARLRAPSSRQAGEGPVSLIFAGFAVFILAMAVDRSFFPWPGEPCVVRGFSALCGAATTLPH